MNCNNKNLGGAIPHCCPKCKSETLFELIITESAKKFFGIPLGKKKVSELSCPECSHKIPLSVHDSISVPKFKKSYNSFCEELITQQQFIDEIKFLHFDFKALEIAANKIILCPHCNEENQNDFEICWNCNKKISIENAEDLQGFPFAHPEENRLEEAPIPPNQCNCRH